MASITQNRSALRHFLASIASIKGDLSNITAPPFVLAPKSTVEYPSSWAEFPEILVAPALEPDPKKRALLVLKWYLCSLKRQTYGVSGPGKGAKKPLNAVLGEVFVCGFGGNGGTEGAAEGGKVTGGGETRLVAEQVSHHPPVTACHLSNAAHSVRASGYTRQSISLSATLTVRIDQIGHAIVYLDALHEAYLVTLPALTVRGLLSGTPYPEFVGESYITGSTGFTCRIEYQGVGMMGGGVRNAFRARVYRTKEVEKVFYEVEGSWSGRFTFWDVEGGERREVDTVDTALLEPAGMEMAEVGEQDSWESRRVWKGVIEGLKVGDFGRVNVEKSRVEVAQREMRKAEVRDGKRWEALFFSNIDKDPVFDELARGIGYVEDAGKTAGVWKFDLEKEGKAQKPYHGASTPLG